MLVFLFKKKKIKTKPKQKPSYVGIFLWIHIPVVMYFQGTLQAERKQAVPGTGRGGKSKALCSLVSGRRGCLGITRQLRYKGIRKKLWGKWRQSVFFSAPLSWVLSLDLCWCSYGCVVITDLVAFVQLWQEGKRQRHTLNLDKPMGSNISAAPYCSQHLFLVVFPNRKIKCQCHKD